MSENEAGTWCLIESDPGVFTELIREFGCKGLQVEELWSLDEDAFAPLKPVHGLIFLFKWVGPSTVEETAGRVVDASTSKIFFPRQVINNACATFAIISILLNLEEGLSATHSVELGKVLSDFKEFTQGFDPAMKGLALTNSDTIRTVHNSFARQSVFEFEDKPPASKDEDVYHFVSFLPIGGRLYELDGLREGPLDHGPLPPDKDWTEAVRPVLQARIGKYSAGEIHFNLMAVIGDRKAAAERRLAELGEVAGEGHEADECRRVIAEEEAKRERMKLENVRRKHNYLPLIVTLLKELAGQQELMGLYQKAKDKCQERRAQRQKEKAGT